MGTGQTLLTIAAMMLLGTVILTTNRNIGDTSDTLLQTNCGLDAVSLATSIIEEADSTAYDQSTVAGVDTLLTQLTAASQLGPEGGSSTDLDDFDDYNGRTDTVTLSTGIYYCATRVYYVGNYANLDQNSSSRTWTKRLDVWVWNKDLPDTVKMHSLYSYWFFGRAGR
jgi:hypothetical protein